MLHSFNHVLDFRGHANPSIMLYKEIPWGGPGTRDISLVESTFFQGGQGGAKNLVQDGFYHVF